jgi:hypothetical protein
MPVNPIIRSLEAELNNRRNHAHAQAQRSIALWQKIGDLRAAGKPWEQYLDAARWRQKQAAEAEDQVHEAEAAYLDLTTNPCPDCKGDGSVECPVCEGRGMAGCSACTGTGIATSGPVEGSCSYCGGRGEQPCDCEDGTVPCETCEGTGRVEKNAE